MSEEIKNTDDQVNEKIDNVDELPEDVLDNVAGGVSSYQIGGSGHGALNRVNISSPTGGADAGKIEFMKPCIDTKG